MILYPKNRRLFHSLIWFGFAVFLFFNIDENLHSSVLSENIFIVLAITTFSAMSAYAAFAIHDKFFQTRKYVWFSISFFVIPFVFAGLFLLLHRTFESSLETGFTQNVVNFIVIMGLALGFRYFKRGIIDQASVQEARVKLLESELNMLKAQLNPHFLFNTLNNIYGVNLTDSGKGSEMLLSLSEVFRYHLELQKSTLIPLMIELDFLSQFIALEKLRLTESTKVTFNQFIESSPEIPPLLFLPFVENAFKYGAHPNKPSFIEISVQQSKNSVTLLVSNQILNKKNAVSSETGIANVKRRLELLFPNNHTLIVATAEDVHSVKLNFWWNER